MCSSAKPWVVTHSLSLGDARSLLARETMDAMVLDLGLPDGNGLELLRALRAQGMQLPVLVLSAQGEELDRVLGLELGADDYLAKPFSPRELVARVKALLRRSTSALAWQSRANCRAVLEEIDGQRILLHGKLLDITRREYRLLSCLLQGTGRIYSREHCWKWPGAMTATATTARSTPMSRPCVPSCGPLTRSMITSKPTGAWATA